MVEFAEYFSMLGKNYLIDIQYLNRMNYQFDSENVLKLWFSFDAVGEVFWFFLRK